MNNLWSQLGSPRNLIIMVTAAKTESFTAAARELGMQQPSVSAAIKQLERDLGLTLFERRKRRVFLTPQGRKLYADASKTLNDLEKSITALQSDERARYVTLSSSSAFAHYWMVPRLHQLHRAHPNVDLRLQSSLREPELDHESIDLGIRLGTGTWPGYDTAMIAKESIFPVAHPRLAAGTDAPRSIMDLTHQPLIHLEEPIRKRPGWHDWFAHHGHDVDLHKSGLRLNDYALVLQAALSGEGYAFGWEHQVRDLIAKNLLAGWQEWAWHTGHAFYLVWSQNRPLSQNAKLVRDWIIAASDFPG